MGRTQIVPDYVKQKQRLHILQIMRAPIGGLFRHVIDLTQGLAERGHAVGIVISNQANDQQTESKLEAITKYTALGVFRFPMPRIFGTGDLSTPLAIRNLARNLHIDVLHGHGAKGGFYARLARIGMRIPVALYTPHGGVLHFCLSSPAGCIFHILERTMMAQTDAIIFESAYAKNTYAQLIGKPTCPDTIIHNGIASAEFTPITPDPDAADFIFVGEFRTLKGIHQLLNAFVDLRRTNGQPATLIMAGDGPDRPALEAQIARLGLTQRVTLPGTQPARKMFTKGRIAVVPSLAESLPYVVLEAAAAQLPVIATRVGGIPEIFGPTAQSLVPAQDVPALHVAMAKALTEPETVRHDILFRLAHIEKHFSLSTMIDQIEAQYYALLTRN